MIVRSLALSFLVLFASMAHSVSPSLEDCRADSGSEQNEHQAKIAPDFSYYTLLSAALELPFAGEMVLEVLEGLIIQNFVSEAICGVFTPALLTYYRVLFVHYTHPNAP